MTTLEELRTFVAASEAAGKRVFFTNRSAIIAKQRCPRSNWLKYHYNGMGLSKVRLNVPMTTGIYTHLPARLLLNGATPQFAIDESLAAYDEEVAKRSLDVEPTESHEMVATEQRALIEAFTWLLHLRVIPELRRDFEVLEVEKDDWFLLYEGAKMVIIVETRADALLRERIVTINSDDPKWAKETAVASTVVNSSLGLSGAGDLYVLSWKTAKQWDKRKLRDARVDMQGLSEAYPIELRLKEPVVGVKMVYLLKGRRDEDPYNPGAWLTKSPLIRSWANSVSPVPQLAWTFAWKDATAMNDRGKAVEHRLGKGWRPVFIPDHMPMREWIEMLHELKVQPEAGDCLAKQYVTPMPEPRSPTQKQAWLRQITGQEMELAQSLMALEGCKEEATAQEALDLMFPQYTHSCTYPSECEMFQICHGGEEAQEANELLGEEGINPLSLYRPREPHHPGELGTVEED